MQNIVFNTTLLQLARVGFENPVHNLDHPLHVDLKLLSKLNPTSTIYLASQLGDAYNFEQCYIYNKFYNIFHNR